LNIGRIIGIIKRNNVLKRTLLGLKLPDYTRGQEKIMSKKNKDKSNIEATENELENSVGTDAEDTDSTYGELVNELPEEEELYSEDLHDAEDMTELIAEKDTKKYTDDELEEMDEKRMAHVIMNDENRTDMDLLGEVFKDDAYSLKLKKKEAKRLAKQEKRIKSGETKGIRFIGTLAILMALAGVALVLVSIYFLAIAPTYNKSDYLTHQLTFPDSATLTDGDYTQMKEGYYVPEIATDDAEMELGGEGIE
jgi:hypothetical protein